MEIFFTRLNFRFSIILLLPRFFHSPPSLNLIKHFLSRKNVFCDQVYFVNTFNRFKDCGFLKSNKAAITFNII